MVLLTVTTNGFCWLIFYSVVRSRDLFCLAIEVCETSYKTDKLLFGFRPSSILYTLVKNANNQAQRTVAQSIPVDGQTNEDQVCGEPEFVKARCRQVEVTGNQEPESHLQTADVTKPSASIQKPTEKRAKWSKWAKSWSVSGYATES